MCEAVNSNLANSVVTGSSPESSNSPSQEAAEFLLLCCNLISAGFTEMMRYRTRQLQSIETALSDSTVHASLEKNAHFLACWLTDTHPFGIGDVLLQFLENLISLGSGEMCPESLGSTYADTTQLAKDATTRAVEYTDTGYFNLLSTDRLDRPEIALTLAERFADCVQMVRLCYLLEMQDELNAEHDPAHWSTTDSSSTRFHHRRLAELLRRVPASYGLADHALQVRWSAFFLSSTQCIPNISLVRMNH
ncbi:unnamed protein product [Echinostoma caproni]|uniref:Fungal_trans domain-containing protein n=1 Tax=Echinostoma caproni TaxID=27848 RepID=A0A183BB11_9TREM|nr:unnamed protein product [Echinostoma caproni]